MYRLLSHGWWKQRGARRQCCKADEPSLSHLVRRGSMWHRGSRRREADGEHEGEQGRQNHSNSPASTQWVAILLFDESEPSLVVEERSVPWEATGWRQNDPGPEL